jgi:hypothetical protein
VGLGAVPTDCLRIFRLLPTCYYFNIAIGDTNISGQLIKNLISDIRQGIWRSYKRGLESATTENGKILKIHNAL